MSTAGRRGVGERRKRPAVVVGGLEVSLDSTNTAQIPPKSLFGRGRVSTKENRAKEPCRMSGVGRKIF